jgi:undecaprenyl-diphosphatase
MGIAENQFTKDFTVIVQFGAILSVLVLYWRRFIQEWSLYLKLLAGFIPVAIIGFALKSRIDALLDNVAVVAVALIVGGIVLIFVDRWFEKQEKQLAASGGGGIETLSMKQAAAIGLMQCLALIPGVSRSAASIIGGLAAKLNRQAAAEFSFLLAVPTLTAASCYKLLKILKTQQTLEPDQLSAILTGNVVSFIVGMITIKAFVGFLTRRGFFAFGVYRIALGAILLALIASGHKISVM